MTFNTNLAVWLAESKECVRFTPDLAKLEERGAQLMFFYDELQYNLPSHDLINEHLLTRITALTTDHYVLHRLKNEDGTAGAIAMRAPFKETPPWQTPRRGTPALVMGELCAILSAHIPELDSYYQNTVECQRERVRVQVPHREVKWTKKEGMVTTDEKIAYFQAWMYVGKPEFFSTILDGGYKSAPARLFEPKRKELENYYRFTRLEYDG